MSKQFLSKWLPPSKLLMSILKLAAQWLSNGILYTGKVSIFANLGKTAVRLTELRVRISTELPVKPISLEKAKYVQ